VGERAVEQAAGTAGRRDVGASGDAPGGGKAAGCRGLAGSREIPPESPRVCPKVVGQLLAVVLQSGQAREIRTHPSPLASSEEG